MSDAPFVAYAIELKIDDICGGFPGTIDAARAFLQNPMMAKRVPESAREEFLARDRDFGLEEGSIPDIVRTGFRRNPEGVPILGNYQIKAMLQQAARALYDTTSRPSIYQVARAITYGIEIAPRDLVIKGGHDGGVRQIAQIVAHPRQPSIRIPNTRERDVWVGGTIDFNAVVLNQGAVKKIMTRETLQTLFETGGLFVGLGTDRGYGYGRFQIRKFEYLGEIDARVVAPFAFENPRRKGIGYVPVRKVEAKVGGGAGEQESEDSEEEEE